LRYRKPSERERESLGGETNEKKRQCVKRGAHKVRGGCLDRTTLEGAKKEAERGEEGSTEKGMEGSLEHQEGSTSHINRGLVRKEVRDRGRRGKI